MYVNIKTVCSVNAVCSGLNIQQYRVGIKYLEVLKPEKHPCATTATMNHVMNHCSTLVLSFHKPYVTPGKTLRLLYGNTSPVYVKRKRTHARGIYNDAVNI